MLRRLMGLETEYAIRYRSFSYRDRPDHENVFSALARAIRSMVRTRPGTRGQGHFFVENGGAFYYEAYPSHPDGGLVEGSTPECRGPSALLTYQKAQESLLLKAIPAARRSLAEQGEPGELGLVKNCRDAEGHVYGVQENYEVEVGRGLSLWFYRAGLGLLMLVAAVLLTLMLLALLPTLFVLFGMLLLGLIISMLPGVSGPFAPMLDDEPAFTRSLEQALGRGFTTVMIVVTWPIVAGLGLLVRACAFRTVRRDLTSFLVTRPIITGAGTLDEDGHFLLSERAASIRSLVRMSSHPDGRAVYDTNHLAKAICAPINEVLLGHVARRLRVRDAPRSALAASGWIFARRQRVQLGVSDANLSQTAEYLKLAITAVLLDLTDAGALRDLPRVKRPVQALHAISADPTLRTEVATTAGPLTALAIQRRYQQRAVEFLEAGPVKSLEATEIVRTWGETLDALESAPERLFGKIDWVTKRALLGAHRDAPLSVQKKIDLRYHELGTGYFARLETEGLAPRLVADSDIETAIRTAPEDSPARRRSALIREMADDALDGCVSWHHAEVQDQDGPRVIRLDDHR